MICMAVPEEQPGAQESADALLRGLERRHKAPELNRLAEQDHELSSSLPCNDLSTDP